MRMGEMRNEGCVLWRGRRREMERGKLWIGVWIRENEREGGGNSWRMREKYWGNNRTSKIFNLQIVRESFTRST